MPPTRLLLWAAVLQPHPRCSRTPQRSGSSSTANASTGCRVATAAGNFDGVEQIVTTTYDGNRPA